MNGTQARCWFCDREVGIEYLIAGYDTWDEQRLACLDCDRAIRALHKKGWLAGGSLDEAWAAAERALPEGWQMLELKNTHYRGEGERWLAMASEADDYMLFKAAYADTPTAALQALTAALTGES